MQKRVNPRISKREIDAPRKWLVLGMDVIRVREYESGSGDVILKCKPRRKFSKLFGPQFHSGHRMSDTISQGTKVLVVEESDSDDDLIGPRIPSLVAAKTGEDSAPIAKKPRDSDPLGDLAPILGSIPSGGLYEASFMHREVVTHVFAAEENEFVITVSAQDGKVKFWKKATKGLEFVKSFSCDSEIIDAAINSSGDEFAVIANDGMLRLFDIKSFNLFGISRTDKVFDRGTRVGKICYASSPGALSTVLAVSTANSGTVYLVNTGRLLEFPKEYVAGKILVHEFPVVLLAYNALADIMVSIDEAGFIEVWSPGSMDHKADHFCKFESKFDTDLFELNRLNIKAVSLAMSSSEYFAVFTSDYAVKIFRLRDGKLVKSIDESLDALTVAQSDPLQRKLHVDGKDFGSRVQAEQKMIESDSTMSHMKNIIVFDHTGEFILYSTIIGIKVVHWKTNRLVWILGKVESTERFTNLALYQGEGQPQIRELTGGNNHQESEILSDPTLIATAFEKNRFYLFTNRLPSGEVRDVNNEPLTQGGLETDKTKLGGIKRFIGKGTTGPPRRAVIHTTMGDIELELFSKECKKTVENFSTHARNGYFDSVIFHRVIRGFMIQTGDPQGDGSGGESIWGSEFQDEFYPHLNHKSPYMVSMANCGPNTNASQFFITTVACPWLDGKHTVFGKVIKGMDVVKAIEETETDDQDRPKGRDIKILTVKISS